MFLNTSPVTLLPTNTEETYLEDISLRSTSLSICLSTSQCNDLLKRDGSFPKKYINLSLRTGVKKDRDGTRIELTRSVKDRRSRSPSDIQTQTTIDRKKFDDRPSVARDDPGSLDPHVEPLQPRE